MDFSFNEVQRELKEKAIKFAVNKLNNNIIIRDKRSEFPFESWKACADFGLQGMPIPKRYTGMNFNILDIIAVLEGIGYGCRDNGLIFSINTHICGCEIPILHFGTEEQKRRYLPRLVSGKSIGAFAITEPEAGSDIFSIKTMVWREKNYYVLNGTKVFVTNGPMADIILVFANTESIKKMGRISCFIIEKGMPGVTIGKNIEKSGLKTSLTSEINFENCAIPKENMLGKENAGILIFNNSMDWERICFMATIVGAMERQIETCIKYVRERKQFGKPIREFQSVSNKIVDMKVRLETGRLMLYKTAWLKKMGRHPLLETSITKLYLSESYIQSSLNAIQIHGAYGYAVEWELERELRDAIASTIYSGTSEIQRNTILELMMV